MNKDTLTIFVPALDAGAVIQSGTDAVYAFQKERGVGLNKPDNQRPGCMTGPGNDET
ncbi:hypothetical protein [Phytobacter sp. V91]|uniref:hypothetical protein n=1 Tax=Phytobacter sp. V91 TaxID=3369425 RepID=UPI003F63FB37